MAEATLVAPAEETKVPQPEESPPSPPASVENQEPQAETSPDSEPTLESALEEWTRSTGTAEDAPTGTESDAKPLSPEAQAEVDRFLADQETTKEKTNRETGIINKLRDWGDETRSIAAQYSIPQGVTDWFVQRALLLMDLKTEVTKIESSSAAYTDTVDRFYTEAAKELPATKRQAFLNARHEHKNHGETIKALKAALLEDTLPKREIEKIKAQTKEELRAFLIEKKLLKGHDAPPAEGSGGVNSASDEALLADPNTPVSTLIAIRERQRRAGG